MLTQNQHFNSLPEGMNLITTCPICNVKYNPMMVRILEEKNDAHLVYITCKNCSSNVVALIMNSGLGITSVGLITDLTAEDVMKFKDAEEVSVDDVLDMHLILEDKSNDYLKVFME